MAVVLLVVKVQATALEDSAVIITFSSVFLPVLCSTSSTFYLCCVVPLPLFLLGPTPFLSLAL